MMNIKKKEICRFCLNVVKNGYQEIDETVKQLFRILLLKLDWDITKDPIICQGCFDGAKKCLYFKSTYIHTEEIVVSFSTNSEKVKHCIKLIYKERKSIEACVNEDLDICRICLIRSEGNNFIPLDSLMNNTVFGMLTKYMPEMDFNITDVPLICSLCRENMEDYFQFVQIYLDTERKINVYCQEEMSDMGLINLSNVLYFSFKGLLKSSVKGLQLPKIDKSGPSGPAHAGSVYPKAYNEIIKQEELNIKGEGTILYENAKTFKCSLCNYKTRRKSSLIRHMLVHKNISELKMFKCSLCAYETKLKSNLKSHMLIHKDISEIKMYKCALCAYKSKFKSGLKSHMLVHKDISEIKMFKCPFCAYETKRSVTLRKHVLVHKDVSEIKMFKCSLCAFESKHDRSLKTHMMIHNDVSELKMFKCSLCSYETKHKSSVTRHMLIHKDVSELNILKCSLCAYETKQIGNLRIHMLVHKDVSELEMFKCSFCAYDTKLKGNHKRHMLIHKDVSQ